MEYYAATKMNDVNSVSDTQGRPRYIIELNRQLMVHRLSHFSSKGKQIPKHTQGWKKSWNNL